MHNAIRRICNTFSFIPKAWYAAAANAMNRIEQWFAKFDRRIARLCRALSTSGSGSLKEVTQYEEPRRRRDAIPITPCDHVSRVDVAGLRARVVQPKLVKMLASRAVNAWPLLEGVGSDGAPCITLPGAASGSIPRRKDVMHSGADNERSVP